MHEYSICCALMQQVEAVARSHRAGQVERIELSIGPLSGVDPALLRQAWPLVATGTVAESAVLDISTGAVTVSCTRCNAVSQVRPNRLLCKRCGDYRTRLLSGDEMLLNRVELSAPPVPRETRSCA